RDPTSRTASPFMSRRAGSACRSPGRHGHPPRRARAGLAPARDASRRESPRPRVMRVPGGRKAAAAAAFLPPAGGLDHAHLGGLRAFGALLALEADALALLEAPVAGVLDLGEVDEQVL